MDGDTQVKFSVPGEKKQDGQDWHDTQDKIILSILL
jgi:hypothetical protein